MAYNTYRNEKTEVNHNVRAAAFETLKNLGETQILVDYAHFKKDRERGDTRLGWGKMTLIHDLSQVLPPPTSVDGSAKPPLTAGWDNGFFLRSTDQQFQLRITGESRCYRCSGSALVSVCAVSTPR